MALRISFIDLESLPDALLDAPCLLGHNQLLMTVQVQLLRAKLHRATVTDANVDYEGSVTIDSSLLEAAQIFPHEQIHIWNLTRGTRLVTYAIRGEANSGVVCINGAAAHLAKPGDKVILATFAQIDAKDAPTWTPRVLLLDKDNRIVPQNQ